VNPDELDYSKEKKKEKSPACHAGESEEPAELDITDLSGVVIDRDFFRNRNVLWSGDFERYPGKNERDTELKLLLKTKFGAIVRGSAVKNLDFFIIGSGPGWSKTGKVSALIKGGRNVQVLTEAQLYDILDRIE
jgi:NAD-dependent DNA ligase